MRMMAGRVSKGELIDADILFAGRVQPESGKFVCRDHQNHCVNKSRHLTPYDDQDQARFMIGRYQSVSASPPNKSFNSAVACTTALSDPKWDSSSRKMMSWCISGLAATGHWTSLRG
jgi:hypothetical protein